jgi:hypothetical protein
MSIPYSKSPVRASPLSFKRMRLYRAVPMVQSLPSSKRANLRTLMFSLTLATVSVMMS